MGNIVGIEAVAIGRGDRTPQNAKKHALAQPELKEKVFLISDTRVSGVSSGAIRVPCSLEAAVGGSIGKLQDEDRIPIAFARGLLRVENHFATRQACHHSRLYDYGYLADFAASTTQSHNGCVCKACFPHPDGRPFVPTSRVYLTCYSRISLPLEDGLTGLQFFRNYFFRLRCRVESDFVTVTSFYVGRFPIQRLRPVRVDRFHRPGFRISFLSFFCDVLSTAFVIARFGMLLDTTVFPATIDS